jgi:beta-glucosidase-like glycosyl hydrolase/CubicO group peptidase (beta-lactamase class C family)
MNYNQKTFFVKVLFMVTIVSITINCASKKSNIIPITITPAVQLEKKKDIIRDDHEIEVEVQEVTIPKYTKDSTDYFSDSSYEIQWSDSIYNTLNLDEKISQLMMVAAYPNKDEIHYTTVDSLITKYKIGGLIFFQGGPIKQAKLNNRFQSKSKIPMLIGIDAEWGLSMRVDSTYKFPFNMTLGAVKDLNLIEAIGKKMGAEAKRMGIHYTFSPVVDINTNPSNPIIGVRSFGEDKEDVTNKAIALMKGINSQGVFATAKHFPGHGDTSTDSHHTLPVLNFTKFRLDEIELYPYKKMFAEGLQSVMVAHLNIPVLEPNPATPSSLSKNIVTDLLKKELGFKGMIITDALNMKGASNAFKPGDIELAAFLAGNDILLMPENVPIAIETIKKAYNDTLFSEERLAESVKKILRHKYKIGLKKYKPIVIDNLYNDINPVLNDSLQYAVYENAITVLKNDSKVLPINDLSDKIAYVKIGKDTNTDFVETLKKYTSVTEVTGENSADLNEKLKDFDIVIVGYHPSDKAWRNTNLTDNEVTLINDLANNNKVIVDFFAKPYTLLPFTNFDAFEGLIISYQNNPISQIVSSEIIFGASQAKGKLPVSINTFFKINDGITTDNLYRLGFSSPEFVGINSEKLNEIENFTTKAISRKMAPGMQILVARKGKVFYQKSFGYHTYNEITKVQNSDIYDVASITKVVATLPNIMQHFDKKKLTLSTTLGEILPVFRDTDKQDINLLDVLTHYGRLQAWKPFYKETLDSLKCPLDKYYSNTYSSKFSRKVVDSLYFRTDYHDTIMKYIATSKLAENKTYKYSDFAFMILAEYLKKSTGKTIDKLTYDNFYKSMGMNYTLYNPLQKFDKSVIPPSEEDDYFRHTIVQGYVHDMAAAMEGGVAGHAGIFSNSMDIAKMMQMYLQKGRYGTKRYFSEETFDMFNNCYYCDLGNRRGLGFDKPQSDKKDATCDCVSMLSFGHTGFTGTIAWADPETEIIYVFLSNRTYPNSTYNILSKENIREDIQKIIQDAIIK